MPCCQRVGVLLLVLPMLSCVHVGQRLLTVMVEVDGAAVLEGHTAVPDYTPVDQMWAAVADAPLKLASGATEPARPLSGNVVVRIQHRSTVLATATLDSLMLTKDPSGSSWTLSTSQVARLQQAAIK